MRHAAVARDGMPGVAVSQCKLGAKAASGSRRAPGAHRVAGVSNAAVRRCRAPPPCDGAVLRRRWRGELVQRDGALEGGVERGHVLRRERVGGE